MKKFVLGPGGVTYVDIPPLAVAAATCDWDVAVVVGEVTLYLQLGWWAIEPMTASVAYLANIGVVDLTTHALLPSKPGGVNPTALPFNVGPKPPNLGPGQAAINIF